MATKSLIDADAVLDLWARGESYNEICTALGVLRTDYVSKIICNAREGGDPRAKRQAGRNTYALNAANYLRVAAAIKHRRVLSKFPVTAAELSQAIQSYTGPITKLQPGFHLGHRAKCLDYFSI